MRRSFSTVSKRLTALLVCLVIMIPAVWVLMPAERECSFGASAKEKSVTIFTNELGGGSGSVSFDAGFGIDTLVTPASATDYEITWESSDTDVAEVDEHGRVLARLTGAHASESSASCTITATCRWNGMEKSDSITINVRRGEDITGCFFFNSFTGALPAMSSLTAIPQEEEAESDEGTEEATTEEVTTEKAEEVKEETVNDALEHDHVEGQVLVVFDDGTRNSRIQNVLSDNDVDLKQITSLGEDQKVALAEADSEEALPDVMESLTNEDAVAYVQPNYIYRFDEDGTVTDGVQDDPYFNEQYFHKLVDTKGAWDLLETNGISQPTIIGLIDSGVDTLHQDLADNLILNDGTFRKYTYSGISDETADPYNHGTHLAGIIGAVYGNGYGGAGVAAGRSNDLCRILPVGVAENDGTIETNSVIQAINYAVSNGAKVINMSFSSEVKDRALSAAIADNYYNNGTVFISSAGNKVDYAETVADAKNGTCRIECFSSPSDLKEVISVCNIQSDGEKHDSSYTGLSKDISAPGTRIYSTVSYGTAKHDYKTGTSMSAPVVTAVAALILDANPDLTPGEVRNIICATAYDKNDYYKSKEMGYGRIVAKACVQAAYDAKNNVHDGDFTFSIKGYYNGEPEPYTLSKTVKSKGVTKSLSKVSSYKAKGDWKKVKLSFRKASLTTITKTETENRYITGRTDITTSTNKKSSTSGVRYQIRVKYDGKTGYYKIKPVKKRFNSITIHPVGKTIRVSVKHFNGRRMQHGRKCCVSVRAYKKINGKIKYSKWSRIIKVRTI